MTQIQLQVPEVHCGHCKSSLEGAVGAMAGVKNVDVSIADTTLDVSFDNNTVALDAIKETIEGQGYAVFG
ncbi:MAG: cation transporter [Actinomycetota bacterium]|nr:cation transporter [Actinomycetota bacterium]